MSKILLVEDTVDLALAIQGTLSEHLVQIAESIAEARKMLEKDASSYDLVLLDLKLPDGSGLGFCAEIKSHERFKALPVMCVSGMDTISEKIAAFSLGAEDYITKPFDVREFRARVQSKLLKRERTEKVSAVTELEGLKIDRDGMRVYTTGVNPTEIAFTGFEFRLLCFFAERKERVLSRTQIMEGVWRNVHVFDRTVDAHISKIRKKLQGSGYTIESVYGSGYVFKKSPTTTSQVAVTYPPVST